MHGLLYVVVEKHSTAVVQIIETTVHSRWKSQHSRWSSKEVSRKKDLCYIMRMKKLGNAEIKKADLGDWAFVNRLQVQVKVSRHSSRWAVWKGFSLRHGRRRQRGATAAYDADYHCFTVSADAHQGPLKDAGGRGFGHCTRALHWWPPRSRVMTVVVDDVRGQGDGSLVGVRRWRNGSSSAKQTEILHSKLSCLKTRSNLIDTVIQVCTKEWQKKWIMAPTSHRQRSLQSHCQ